MLRGYGSAFPAGYREAVPARLAVRDSGVMEKLGLASRSALVRFAIDCGALTPGAHAA